MELNQQERSARDFARICTLPPQQIIYIFEQLRDTKKSIDLILSETTSQSLEQFIQMLLNIISLPALSVQFGQAVAISIGAIITMKRQTDFQLSVKLAFAFMTNFDIEPQWKLTIQKRIADFIYDSQNELENLFEKVVGTLAEKLMNLISQNTEQSLSVLNRVTLDSFYMHFDFVFQYPHHFESVCRTIILLGEIFVTNQSQNKKYIQILIQVYRKINITIFRQQVIQFKPQLVLKLLQFWELFIQQVVQLQDQDSQEYLILEQIVLWPEFHQQINLIFNFLSQNFLDSERGIVVHNYFAIPPQQKEVGLLTIKGKAVFIYDEMFKACGYQFWHENKIGLKHIFWSITYSLTNMVELSTQQFNNAIEQAKHFISFFRDLVQHKIYTFTREDADNFLEGILLPIMDLHMEKLRYQFSSEGSELMEDLQDSQDQQIRDTVISSLVKLLDAFICGYYYSTLKIIALCRQSLEHNLFKNASDLQQAPSRNNSTKKLKIETCIFTLLSISEQDGSVFKFFPELKFFFTSEAVRKCDQFQKAIYFFFFSYVINTIFDPTPQTNDLALTAMEFPMSHSLKRYALDFLSIISGGMLFPQTISTFIQRFKLYESNPDRWCVLQRFFSYNLHNLDYNFILNFINETKANLQQELINLAKEQNIVTNQIYKYGDVIYLLRICRGISSEINYCRQHPQIKNALWELYLLQGKFDNFDVGDLLIDIGNYLILCQDLIPHFSSKILSKFSQYFSSCQYQGANAYAFIYTVIQKARNEDIQIIHGLGQIICEVATYLIYFPDGLHGLEDHLKANLSYSILMYQTYLLKFYPQLNQRQKNNAIECCTYLMNHLSQLQDGEEMPLRGRAFNFYLILLLDSETPFQIPSFSDLMFLVQNRAFVDYDACLLVSLFIKLFDSFSEKQRYQMIYVTASLQKWELIRQEQRKNNIIDFKNKSYFSIFHYINMTCEPYRELCEYVAHLLYMFKEKDPNYSTICQKLPPKSYEQLQKLFEFYSIPKAHKSQTVEQFRRRKSGWGDQSKPKKNLKRSRPKIKAKYMDSDDEEQQQVKRKPVRRETSNEKMLKMTLEGTGEK